MDPSPYAGSGAGGKIRRRPPPRAAATPYARPPAAAAAHRLAAAAAAASSGPSGEGGTGGGGGSSGWVSRLVDPASRLLAGGAARLFSSVFRKRLEPAPAQAPPPSSPSGRNVEPKQDNSTPALEDGMGEKKPAGTPDEKALSEVEHLLMRKTFTRVEFDRLTDLLRERTIESDLPAPMVSGEKNEGSTRINEPGGSTSHGMATEYSPTVKVRTQSSPTVKVSNHRANSPAELAKQYMSSRYSREPQSSSFRSRLFLENKGETSNIAYDRRSGQPVVQQRIEFGNENPGLPVNGYSTPGLHGRSAIYRMSRSPYFKGLSSSGDVKMSSLSQQAQSLHAGGRQVLKRRAADLENEHGSIGPIRRIRQKSNMMSSFRDASANPRGNLLTSRTSGSDFTEDRPSSNESPSSKRLLLGAGLSVRAESHKDGGDVKSIDTIPPQSNKMAEKIFEQLDIIAPSPKAKQSGKQPVANNSSLSMSKETILQDNGPSRIGDPSSSLKYHDLAGVNEPLDQEYNVLQKGKLRLTNDGSSKVASPDNIFGNSVSAAKSRKPGFKMAVLEDLPELDDDLEAPIAYNNSPSKIEVGNTEEKLDSSNRKEQKVEQKAGPNLLTENVVGSSVSERPIASVTNTVSSSGLLSPNDPGKTDIAHSTAENNTDFTFTRTGSATSALPVASVQENKQDGASTSIFGLKQSSRSDVETSTAADVKNKAGLFQSVSKPTTELDSTSSEKGDKREREEDAIHSSDKLLPPSTTSLSNGFSFSSSPKLTPADKPTLSSAPSTSMFSVPSSSPAISSSAGSSPAFSFGYSTKVGSSVGAPVKSEIAEGKPASTLTFGIGGTTAEAKSSAPDSDSKPPSKLFTSPISSNISTFSSYPTSSASTSVSTISSSPVAASSVAASTTIAPSSTSSTTPVQSASTASFMLSSSGGIFGFSSPAQSTGVSTSVASSNSQPPAASAVFGSKPPQSEAMVSQPPQSSVAQFGLSFPTSGAGASTGSGTVSFGVGASSAGSGAISFGVGTSSSAPGTASFGATASSSGPGIFSFGAGTSSSGSGTVSFGLGAGAASSGPGTVSFGAGAASSGPGIVSFEAGTASSGPGTVSFGIGAASSGPGAVSFGAGTASTGAGTMSFGVGAASSGSGAPSFGLGAASSGSGSFSFSAGAASSGSGTVSFGAGASSSGPSTVSFGATTSASGFGNSQFGAGSTFSTPFSSSSGAGFPFSSPSSSAVSSTVASTSVFSSSSAASSTSSFSNPFGSSSSTSSTFTFGQSASSGGGFSFGAQSAPAFSSQPPVFSFTSASTSMNSSTAQPAFGMTNTNTGFGTASTGNDQMNEDSMADDTNQAAPTPAPIFGGLPFGQQPAAPLFGAPSVQPTGVFQFGGQQQGSAPQNPAFPPGGSLEFQSGGFSLGSGGAGGDKSNRRVIKVKRGPKKR